MDTKLVEIRDAGTFIPAVAVLMASGDPQERYLLRRCGYGHDQRCVLLTALAGGRKAECDVYAWACRTWQVAHDYLEKNWDEVRSGDVVDVEFIAGVTSKRKVSERFQDIGEYEACGVDAVIAAMERTAKGPHV